jgi:hypothetical protein
MPQFRMNRRRFLYARGNAARSSSGTVTLKNRLRNALEKLRKKQSLNYRTGTSRSSPERLVFPMAAQTGSLLRFGLLGLAALRRKLT